MSKLSCVTAAIALLMGSASLAQQTPAPAPADPEKKICKTDRSTGSLTRRTRTCLTAAEWRLLNERARSGVDGVVRDAGVNAGAGSVPGA